MEDCGTPLLVASVLLAHFLLARSDLTSEANNNSNNKERE